ncbi:MAG TPA: L,D-transpeptidase family protein, partial [Sphingomicrobium sp.]
MKNAPIDGLAEGPALAAKVEAALASGLATDDPVISEAWVRYVQALRRPVSAVSFGDPSLKFHVSSPDAILSRAAAAATPSLAAYVERVSRVNPFYSALREAAQKQGKADDPHVLATLDRLRLVPGRGHAILVDVANAELMMLDDGNVVDRMKVIVGKPDFQTPLLAGTINYVTF